MTSTEFKNWFLFSQIEPFGSRHEDSRFGVIAAVIANTNRKKGKPAVKIDDFFPPYEKRSYTQTVEDQISIVEMLNAAFGGKDLRQGKTPTG